MKTLVTSFGLNTLIYSVLLLKYCMPKSGITSADVLYLKRLRLKKKCSHRLKKITVTNVSATCETTQLVCVTCGKVLKTETHC